jgi:AcrR family transcriptional regulator
VVRKVDSVHLLNQHGGVNFQVSRRERVRLATIDEIKQVAREQLASHGPAGVSLRAVARAMGMTPSALYRYVDSREDLILALAADAFRSLADALETGYDAAPDDDHLARWRSVTRAYRRWAQEHSVEYGLIFTSPLDHAQMKESEAGTEMHRSIAVLFRCMTEAIADGIIDPTKYAQQLTPALRAQFEGWREHSDVTFPTEGLVGCLTTWIHLHGFLTLELFGHLPPFFVDADDAFDQQMYDVLLQLGYQVPAAR